MYFMKKVRILQCCLLIAALLLLFVGCAEKKQKIDWDLSGTWITADGEIGENISFSIEGEFDTEDVEPGNLQIANFTVQRPEDFRYGSYDEAEFAVYAFREAEGSASVWFLCIGWDYDPATNSMITENLLFSLEREYGVVYWPEREGNYIVASTDPETDPQDIPPPLM